MRRPMPRMRGVGWSSGRAVTGINMSVYPSKGSVENIYAVYQRPGVQVGIVQSDVLAFVARVQTDQTLQRIAKKIKMVFPLYNEEVPDRLWAEAHAPVTRWRRTVRIVGGATVAASIAALVSWGLFTPRPAEPPPPAQSTPPAAKQAAVGTASTPRTSPTERRTASPPGPTARAAGRPEAARATPPSAVQSSAAPSPKAEPREQSRSPQAPAGPARDQQAASSEEEAYDPGAVIDWLLRSPKRGQ